MIINNVNTSELTKFQTVLDIIEEQFRAVMSTDLDFYSDYEIEIKNEQYFVPDDERDGHKIFIVVKFLPAEIHHGQDIMPITIQATSECNGVAAAQRLLFEYTQIFDTNTLTRDDKIIYQNYKSPNVISNFELVYEGYRSLLIVSGTFLISSDINRITLLYFDGNSLGRYTSLPDSQQEDLVEIVKDLNSDEGGTVYKWTDSGYIEYFGDEIDIINYTDTFDATPDTQPYFETNNFTESIIKYGTFSFNVASYLTKSSFNKKVLRIVARRNKINANFYFRIVFDETEDNMPLIAYKLLNATKQQNIGEMPTIVTAFTN